jgi:hypothetical protein
MGPMDEPSRTRGIAVAGVIALALGAGSALGGYFLGKSSGEDLQAARLAGERAGQQAGAASGAEKGYAQGFTQGRKKGYRNAYESAYRKTYRQALRDAGFSPSKRELKSIPKPAP